MKIFKRVITLSILILVGCAGPVANGPVFSDFQKAGQEESQIYVYKPFSGDGITLCLKLLLNEKEYGCLEGEGFIKSNVPPGKYNLVLQTDTFMGPRLIEYEFIAEAGETYFYEFLFSWDGVPEGAVDTKSVGVGIFSEGVIVTSTGGKHVLIQKQENEALQILKNLRESAS